MKKVVNQELLAEIRAMLSNNACSKPGCKERGDHLVCGKCGAHYPGGNPYVTCEGCGAKGGSNYYHAWTSMTVVRTSRVTPWENEFLLSCMVTIRRRGDVSPKQRVIVDRIRAKLTSAKPMTDAIACCPKRGKTFKAICEAIGFSPLMDEPDRETMEIVRSAFRALVSERTGYETLPNVETFSDALRVVERKSDLERALMSLLDYYNYMVRVGRFNEAA